MRAETLKIYLHRNGSTYGPYAEETLRVFQEAGQVGPEDLACRSGSEEWVHLGELLGEQGEESTAEVSDDGLSDEEVLENALKIKTLVESDKEEFAIELVRGLNEPKLYSELLRGCSIDEEEEVGRLWLPDWLWNEEDEDRDHRSFFLNLIIHCPEEAEIDAGLRRENITNLNLFESSSLTNVDGLSGLTNLTELNLCGCSSLTADQVDELRNALPECKIIT